MVLSLCPNLDSPRPQSPAAAPTNLHLCGPGTSETHSQPVQLFPEREEAVPVGVKGQSLGSVRKGFDSQEVTDPHRFLTCRTSTPASPASQSHMQTQSETNGRR